jgi:hypothetical protein
VALLQLSLARIADLVWPHRCYQLRISVIAACTLNRRIAAFGNCLGSAIHEAAEQTADKTRKSGDEAECPLLVQSGPRLAFVA